MLRMKCGVERARAAERNVELGSEAPDRGRIQVVDTQNVYIVFIDGFVACVGYKRPCEAPPLLTLFKKMHFSTPQRLAADLRTCGLLRLF